MNWYQNIISFPKNWCFLAKERSHIPIMFFIGIDYNIRKFIRIQFRIKSIWNWNSISVDRFLMKNRTNDKNILFICSVYFSFSFRLMLASVLLFGLHIHFEILSHSVVCYYFFLNTFIWQIISVETYIFIIF